MSAVTQQIPNFLGGVSRQTDDKKLINQLTECVNGYPDPTFGLLKRPGMQHIEVLNWQMLHGSILTVLQQVLTLVLLKAVTCMYGLLLMAPGVQ